MAKRKKAKKSFKRIKKWFLGKKKGEKRRRSIKKKTASKKKTEKEEKFEVGFEEVKVTCASCGKEFRIVKSSQFSTEGMLCQRCAAGGGIGFEEEGDI